MSLSKNSFMIRARIYSSNLGRFLSLDPKLFDGSSSRNLYVYNENNPIIYFDPNGENPLLIFKIIDGLYNVYEYLRETENTPDKFSYAILITKFTSGKLKKNFLTP